MFMTEYKWDLKTIGEMELSHLFDIIERRKVKEEKEKALKEQQDLQRLLGMMT